MEPEVLGTVSFPSGRAIVVDTGLLSGGVDPDTLVVATGLPEGGTFDVVGTRVGEGEWAQCWREVSVVFAPDLAVAQSVEIGQAVVDCARLMFIDAVALSQWRDDESLDGKADFVFWGRDAALLAAAIGAEELDEGFGWRDLDVEECVRRGTEAERVKEERGWKLATDYRPHTHHYSVLAQARASATESGVLDLAGSRLCMFFTTWGDGVFPVFRDVAADGTLVRLRIQLETSAAVEAMALVNG